MTKLKHMFTSTDLMEVIAKHRKYKQLMDKFTSKHPEYAYNIEVIPGDLWHSLKVNIK
jgi:hypothetical protein